MGKIGKALRRNILVGLVLVTPVGLTIWIANVLFQFVTNFFIPKQFLESGYELQLRAAALLVVLMLLFLVGFFVRSFLGKRLYQLSESALVRIPVINKIYISVRQLSEAILAQRQTLFRDVVLIEYPRKGLYCIAFVTATVPNKFRGQMKGQDSEDGEMLALFVPTTPNPTSGVLVFSPRKDVKHLDIAVGDAMKLVVSAGAVYPGDEITGQPTPTLLDKLEEWVYRESKADGPVRDDTVPEKDEGSKE